ncbi:MAG: alpha/beta hydrolase [Chlamydiae bacterium]|nr:alpha/beta hydrolase [Chlamydiota bacterium]
MTLAISNSITFNAKWTKYNHQLQDTLMQRISRFALYYLHKFAIKESLPSSKSSLEKIKNKRESFNLWISQHNIDAIPIEITTPDGIKIRGTFIKLHHCPGDAPLIIFSQPNSCISTSLTFKDIIQEAVHRYHNCNFLIYDYRGCGESEGEPLVGKDFIIDGDAVYQFAVEVLKVPPEKIHMLGYSFGGGVSAQIKAMHPECTGNYVNDRSFTTLPDVALEKFNSKVISYAAYGMMHFLGWNILNTVEALKKIKSKVLIIFHPKDPVILGISQLYLKIPTFNNFFTINLSDRIIKNVHSISVHGIHLKYFTNANDIGAHLEALDFLLKK